MALAGMLAVFSGLLCVLAGLAGSGFIADLLFPAGPLQLHERDRAVRAAESAAQALRLLHRRPRRDPRGMGLRPRGRRRCDEPGGADHRCRLPAGDPRLQALALDPGVLVAVVAATVAVGIFGLAERYDLSVVGPLPQGLPSFAVPGVSADDFRPLRPPPSGSPWSHSPTPACSPTFAIRGGYRVDANQELVALGTANVAAGLFQGFSVSSSSRGRRWPRPPAPGCS